jgi:hypothetical protein
LYGNPIKRFGCNRELIGFRPGYRLLENKFLVLIKLLVSVLIYLFGTAAAFHRHLKNVALPKLYIGQKR